MTLHPGADLDAAPDDVVRAGDPAPPAPRAAAHAPQQGRGAVFAREAARKLLHIGGAIVAGTLAWVLPDAPRRVLFLAVAAFALGFDLARLAWPALGLHFQRALRPMLRGNELGRITGATTLAIGFLLAVMAFPRAAASAGILYAGLADAAGALVGRAFGRHRFPGGRSLEGSLAFLATAFLIGWALPSLGPAAALAVALVLTSFEAIPLPFDDNLLIPLLGAGLTFLASRLA
ncbi:MAG TPA: hypothetical protein VF832_07480 [Longimicrobiales bacterium]